MKTFLSYLLDDNLSAYGDGQRISIEITNNQDNGDSCNGSTLTLPTHYGTHIDFPFHFSKKHRTSNNYSAEDFIFSNILFIDLTDYKHENLLISVETLEKEFQSTNYDCKAELLLVKTGFYDKRDQSEYWQNNLGFGLGTAKYIKKRMPNIKAIAFDLISITSYQNRKVGKIVHKEYLIEEDIIIVEDVNLREIDNNTIINEIIISPLRVNNLDGAPATIIADIN
jgi:kynurenine formamidase|tara:strand:- start:47 stop:721 length:675 start_codon:yes stop_codon:yes gene_type:complete